MIISINKPVLKTTLTKIESQVYQTNYDSHQQVYHNLNENKSKLLKTNFFIEKGNHDMLLPQRRCSHLMFYVKRGSPCEINYHLPPPPRHNFSRAMAVLFCSKSHQRKQNVSLLS